MNYLSTAKMLMHRRLTTRLSCALFIGICTLLLSSSAFAIPSPDLVLNLSASVAQLLGLVSVVFGGFAFSSKKKSSAKKVGSSNSTRLWLSLASVALLGSLAANVLQYTSSVDQKNARLHTNLVRKSVENGESVGDISLKTLSFSEQLDHPKGISTQTLADWLANGESLNIIDVRENEEFEMGSIEGAAHLRYPDVLSRASLFSNDSKTVLLCFSGNRSSELCEKLTEQGKQCNFMVGGYEKWLTESRPLSSVANISTEDLRQLPPFKNKDVLLDTPDVHQLVQERGARFIDVRYPNDFVKDHLPDAINITMRALSSAALAERINSLDDKPYIAACYDKRSCFYSQLIGLRLERAGLEFLGRYSVPHEYYIPSASKRAHVLAWQQNQEQLTLASYVVKPLQQFLNLLTEQTGHYAFALLIIVFLIRLGLLPMALKAERDTRVQKSLSGRIKDLRDELGEHPRALSEATMQLYKSYRIRPIVNMLSSLFQLLLLLLFYSAVNGASTGWSHELAWLKSASAPDPLLILPILSCCLFLGVLCLQSPVKTLRKALLFALGGAALLWLLVPLGAAVNLYLGFSMLMLIVQTLAFKALGNSLRWDMAGKDKVNTIDDTGLIPLSKAHYLPDSTGKKASRLGQLIEAGYNVPQGFVFTSEITNRVRRHPERPLLRADEAREVARLWKKMGGKGQVAVRSSGANEDGSESSFAGVYESVLNISRDELEGAVRQVYLSLGSDRSAAYSQNTGVTTGEIDQGGVVVQAMVDAEYAGVMFTEHPGSTGAMMVEMVSGLGEELVSGNVTPDTYAFGKLTGDLLIEDQSVMQPPPINMQPLLVLGRELEAMFGQPQDIEWAYARGTFFLLQARDITRSISNGDSLRSLAERERNALLKNLLGERKRLRSKDRLNADAPVYVQNELSELLPRPTPLSADLMEKLWAAGGSTDLACQDLGVPYQVHFRSVPYINTVFGWTYVNKQEERRRLGKGPGMLASFRLSRDAEQVETRFRDDFLPQFQADMVERNAIDFERLTLEASTALLRAWSRRFIEDTYRVAERINISADFHMKTALEKLKAAGLEPTAYLNDGQETVVTRAMSLLSGEQVSDESIEEFLLTFGHRAPMDYELAAPRFNEDAQLVQQYITRSAKATAAEPVRKPDIEAPKGKVLSLSLNRARNFMRLKEEAKHYCLIELAQIRRLLLSMDKQCQLDGRIFYLRLQEIEQLADRSCHAELSALADKRYAESIAWQALQLPASLTLSDLERIDMLSGTRPDIVKQSELNGNRVAGEKEVVGTVRVISSIDQIHTFEEGEILVARMTDPTWYPLFAQARGIVTEVGGWLSHAAIVAREYDLPAIVGVSGACQRLRNGDVIRMSMTGSIHMVNERREPESQIHGLRHHTSQMPEGMSNAANDLTKPVAHPGEREQHNVYQLTARKLYSYRQGMERRAMKDKITDRRSEPRYDSEGNLQPDRREANRIANARNIRKAS